MANHQKMSLHSFHDALGQLLSLAFATILSPGFLPWQFHLSSMQPTYRDKAGKSASLGCSDIHSIVTADPRWQGTKASLRRTEGLT